MKRFNQERRHRIGTVELYGLPTDTPMFEKNGWLGDALMTNETAIYNFGMQRIYRKWLDDVRDSRDANGLIPVIAPTGGWGRWNSVEWGAAYPLIVWSVYQHYGDRSLLVDHFAAITKYADYLASQARPDGTYGSTLGDWVPPNVHGNPPEGASHTATAYTALVDRTVADMAGALGREADVRKYRDHEAAVTTVLNAKFLDRAAGIYTTEKPAGYRQTASILPLAMGLTPAAEQDTVFANLVADVHRKNGHLDTGILGTRYLLPLLTARGESELAYRVATQTTFPSWGYFVSQGATSLWEMWDDGARSRDHHMLGSIDQWFYEDLAGIKPTAPGYASFSVTPHAPGDLTSASARLRTVRGEVASSWRKSQDGTFALDVTVPVGATGTVSIPAASRAAVTEGGRRDADGVTFLRYADGRAVFSVGAGTFRFRAAPPH